MGDFSLVERGIQPGNFRTSHQLFYLTGKWSSGYSIRVANRETKEDRTEVLQGTLDLMVFQTLATLGPQHGYAIGARIEQVSNGAIQLNMGTLYPALVRLEQRGYIRSKWDTTENNRRARFYELTAPGRKQLEIERAGWERMTGIMHRLLNEI
jgi:transcriptional regulator